MAPGWSTTATAGHGDRGGGQRRPFIGNLDQVRRLRDGLPLAPLNPATLYGGGAERYTDYPVLQPVEA